MSLRYLGGIGELMIFRMLSRNLLRISQNICQVMEIKTKRISLCPGYVMCEKDCWEVARTLREQQIQEAAQVLHGPPPEDVRMHNSKYDSTVKENRIIQ